MDKGKSFAILFAAIGVLALTGGSLLHIHPSLLPESLRKGGGNSCIPPLGDGYRREGTTEINYSLIEYTAVGTGTVITAQGIVGSSPPDHQVGDVVDILYDPWNHKMSTLITSETSGWPLSSPSP
jgi:hypothetical protein